MSARRALRPAPGLTLPRDAITQSFALLAVRRAGKSNAAVVIAEQMYQAGLPWVAIDPKGDWWGLRSSQDGHGPGLPIPIFGGLHGDMPLVPEAGALIAELIVSQNLTCILDVSEFPSDAAQMRFLTDFARTLYRLHGQRRTPRHLFLEEADDFLPQTVRANQAPCVGAWTKLVKMGGQRGLGITLISQRSAAVNKNALTQVETLIAMRTPSPQDRDAIRDWVRQHPVGRELVDSLPGLKDGEAWVCSPHWLTRHGQPAVQRIRFSQRTTFDSGATPTMEEGAPVATLADIDLGSLRDRMAEVTEKAAQDDPKALRRRIAELERQLQDGGGEHVRALEEENRQLLADLREARSRPPEQVPVLTPGDVAAAEQVITGLRDVAGNLEIALARAGQPGGQASPGRTARHSPAPTPADQSAAPAAETDGNVKLGKPHQKVLSVLAHFPRRQGPETCGHARRVLSQGWPLQQHLE